MSWRESISWILSLSHCSSTSTGRREWWERWTICRQHTDHLMVMAMTTVRHTSGRAIRSIHANRLLLASKVQKPRENVEWPNTRPIAWKPNWSLPWRMVFVGSKTSILRSYNCACLILEDRWTENICLDRSCTYNLVIKVVHCFFNISISFSFGVIC